MRLDRFKVEEFLQELADKVEYSAYCPECDDDAEFDFEIGVKDGAVIQFVQEWFEGTRKEAGFLIDNPELDATDGAHPAWWRGHDHAVAALCQKINEIFDGKDNGEGVSGEPWEGVRCKLRNAAALIRSPARQRDSFRPSGGFTRFYYSAALSSFEGWVKG